MAKQKTQRWRMRLLEACARCAPFHPESQVRGVAVVTIAMADDPEYRNATLEHVLKRAGDIAPAPLLNAVQNAVNTLRAMPEARV